jgi:hypothetical protein
MSTAPIIMVHDKKQMLLLSDTYGKLPMQSLYNARHLVSECAKAKTSHPQSLEYDWGVGGQVSILNL